ncbi:hypothetical protein D3C71_1245240 [compost metagenome]
MRRTPAASGCVRVLVRIGPQLLEKLVQVSRGEILVDDQHRGRHGNGCHRREVIDALELQVGIQDGVDRVIGGGDQARVAVGLGPCDGTGGDGRVGAGAVLHNHRLAERLAQIVGGDAGNDIRGASHGESNDEAQRTRGVIVSRHRRDAGNQSRGRDQCAGHFSCNEHLPIPERVSWELHAAASTTLAPLFVRLDCRRVQWLK